MMAARWIATILLAIALPIAALVPDSWVNIFYTDDAGKLRVRPFPSSGVDHIDFWRSPIDIEGASRVEIFNNDGDSQTFKIDTVTTFEFGTNVPTIYINIDDGAEVQSKEEYLRAALWLYGYGQCADLDSVPLSIKGRGNSTWVMPKKPYRLKFDKKVSLCGMKAAKSYVLIANFIDETLMHNALAFQVARQMGLQYTNSAIPVNLIVNGRYDGSYMLTEKIGVNGSSVNIDEREGIIFELDLSFDEKYRFHSNSFLLPVMVRDPHFDDLAESDTTMTAEERFEMWRDDFNRMEAVLAKEAPGDIADYIDLQSFADYLLVYTVCANGEPGWPKSCNLYKEHPDSLYKAGPVWDFDWAFNFYNTTTSGTIPYTTRPLSGHYGRSGYYFYMAIVRSTHFREVYNSRWKYFMTRVWPGLINYYDRLAEQIRVSALQNGERWPQGCDDRYPCVKSTEDFDEHVAVLRKWWSNRINYLNNDRNHGL